MRSIHHEHSWTHCARQGTHLSTFGRKCGSYVQLESIKLYAKCIGSKVILTWLLKKQNKNGWKAKVTRQVNLPERWHEPFPKDRLQCQHQRFCLSCRSGYEWIYPRSREGSQTSSCSFNRIDEIDRHAQWANAEADSCSEYVGNEHALDIAMYDSR